jgi:sugar lactone lactonase YvrE
VILHPDDKINYVTDTPQRVVQVVPFESNKTKAWLVELAPAQNPN